MPIKLDNIKNIATIIKTKYGNNLCEMNFVFCFKKSANSYFIFQEIQGMPIKRVVYHESNNSVSFMASWAAWSNPYSLVTDANFDKLENWKDLLDRSRPYNSFIDVDGGFQQNLWKSTDKRNKNEKDKRHKKKTDTFVEFRIDKIKRATFNRWGFELYSPTISIIGFRRKRHFPYVVQDIELIDVNDDSAFIPVGVEDNPIFGSDIIGHNNGSIHQVSWQGGSFNIPEITDSNEEVSQVSSGQLGSMVDLSSYWDINSCDEENDKFDEEIANNLLDDREFDEIIFDVGQKEIDLYFGD